MTDIEKGIHNKDDKNRDDEMMKSIAIAMMMMITMMMTPIMTMMMKIMMMTMMKSVAT